MFSLLRVFGAALLTVCALSLAASATAGLTPNESDKPLQDPLIKVPELVTPVVQDGAVAPVPGPLDNPLGPPIISLLEGCNFEDNLITTPKGFVNIPPDPSGAAGPGHLVKVINTLIRWSDKTGGAPVQMGLATFFASASPDTSGMFDPKVLYDQESGRFVVVALERVPPAACPIDTDGVSRMHIAVSKTSDPNAGWWFLAVNTRLDIGGIGYWADYPGIAIDRDAIYVTNNMFPFCPGVGIGPRLWIVHKEDGGGGFYDGGPATVTLHDFVGPLGAFAVTTMPAHVFGAIPGGGTYLVGYSGISTDTVLDCTGVEVLQIIRVTDPLGVPTFAFAGTDFGSFVTAGNIECASAAMPNAPQPACTLAVGECAQEPIETNDRRALHAVWRNDNLYAVATIVPNVGTPSAGEATAHWWRVDTSGGDPFLFVADQGDVDESTLPPRTHTFFPAIAVDGCDNVAIGFSAAGESLFGSACYTGRRVTDVPGTTQTSVIYALGLDCYMRTFAGPGLGARNRWGDYSGLSVDPADDCTFWAFNEYALERGTGTGTSVGCTEFGRWGTRWANFRLNNAPVAICQNINVVGDSTTVCVNNSVTAADIDFGSFDPDGDPLILSLEPPGPYTLGINVVQLIVSDGCKSDTCQATITVDCPVPVELSAFSVSRTDLGAVLRWEVSEATDHDGFRVYRDTPATGRVVVTDLMIGRSAYEFVDHDAPDAGADYWLAEMSRSGDVSWHGPVTLAPAATPTALVLGAAPNPFSASTRITYQLPSSLPVRVSVFDMQGRRVAQLVDRVEAAGSHTVVWDGRADNGRGAVVGFYLLRLEAGSESRIQKIVRTR